MPYKYNVFTGEFDVVNDPSVVPVTEYVVDASGGTPYSTIQSALDAANTAGGNALIYVRPGTYIEDLTTYATLVVRGETNETIIQGVHTPPATGDFSFENVTLNSATDIFNSAAAGTGDILIRKSVVEVTNGYTFNMDNWVGGIYYADSYESLSSVNNGFVNNTGGATVEVYSSIAGAGTTNTATYSDGTFTMFSSSLASPLSLSGTSTANIDGGSFVYSLETADTAAVEFVTGKISSGAATAITHNSSTTMSLADVTIDTSAVNAIDGTGTINLGSITYLDSTGIAGTITLSTSEVLETPTLYTNNISFDRSSTLNADGQLWIGSGAGNPAPANLTSTGGSVTITNGNNSINLEVAVPGAVSQDQIYYVGKHGNDADSGLNIEQAVLTFGQAITLATAAVPGAANRFAIVCLDDGIYTENITIPEFVDIYAPNAGLVGNIIGNDNSSIKLRSQSVATGNIGISKTAGTEYFFVDIDNIDLAGNAIGVVATAGFINITWKVLTVENGAGIGDLSTALSHIHVKGGDIYITGTGIGIGRDNTGATVGHIDHILDTGGGNGTGIFVIGGEFDIQVNRIEDLSTGIFVQGGNANVTTNTLNCTTSYNISGGTLNLHANQILGAETSTGGTRNIVSAEDGINGVVIGDTVEADGTFSSVTDTSRTEHAVSIYGASGILSEVGPLTNGQLVIGNTGNAPVAATLTSTDGTVTITNGAGSVDLSAANAEKVVAVTLLDNTDSPYTVLAADYHLSCDVSSGALTLALPNAPTTGTIYSIKDSGGNAATNNITVTTAGGAVNIDGATSYVMNTNYQSIRVVFNSSSWEII